LNPWKKSVDTAKHTSTTSYNSCGLFCSNTVLVSSTPCPPNQAHYNHSSTKIRVLREGFDVEGISRAWGVEIQDLPSSPTSPSLPSTPEAQTTGGAEPSLLAETDTTTSLYEQQIQNPHPPAPSQPKLEVECTPDQTFLAAQAESLDRYRAEDEAAKKAREARRVANGSGTPSNTSTDDTGSRAMAEHVGPVQFNMGGIQYDADEVLRRLKVNDNIPSLFQNKPLILKFTGTQ
jgi:dynein light intermediate chain 1